MDVKMDAEEYVDFIRGLDQELLDTEKPSDLLIQAENLANNTFRRCHIGRMTWRTPVSLQRFSYPRRK